MNRHAPVFLIACAIAALSACDRRDMPENQPTPQPTTVGEDPTEPDKEPTAPETPEERPQP